MRRMLPVTAVLSAALLAAPPAHAGKLADTTSSGPLAPAGNAVVYSVFRTGDAAARLRLARPGHASRLIFSQKLRRGYQGEPIVAVPAASSRRVGLITTQERGRPSSNSFRSLSELWTGRVTGPLKQVVPRCHGVPGSVAVADNALVTIEGTCTGVAVVVRDYAKTGQPRTISTASRLKALTATGHLAAWRQRNRRAGGHWTYSIVVYDIAKGRVVHRIPNGGWADYLSVQADGKVAGQSASGPIVNAWYSATSTVRHDVPVGSVTPPQLGADKLLYSANTNPQHTGETTLSLHGLDGSESVVASFPGRGFLTEFRNATYDGRRVAFIRKGCTSNELWLLDAGGPPLHAPDAC